MSLSSEALAKEEIGGQRTLNERPPPTDDSRPATGYVTP